MAYLFDEQTVDGIGQPFEHEGPTLICLTGGPCGATVTLDVSLSGEPGSWMPCSRVQLKHKIAEVLDYPGRYWLRARLQNAGAMTKVTLESNQ